MQYRDIKNSHGRWLRGLFGISFLPANLVTSVFNKYASKRYLVNKNQTMNKFINYIKSTYTGPSATFQPSMWSGLNGQVTNNGAEAFHRHFGDLFGYLRSKPSIWHFIRNMKRFNTLKDIKLRSSRPVSQSPSGVSNLLRSYLDKDITVRALLYKLSKKNQPKVKRNYKRKI